MMGKPARSTVLGPTRSATRPPTGCAIADAKANAVRSEIEVLVSTPSEIRTSSSATGTIEVLSGVMRDAIAAAPVTDAMGGLRRLRRGRPGRGVLTRKASLAMGEA